MEPPRSSYRLKEALPFGPLRAPHGTRDARPAPLPPVEDHFCASMQVRDLAPMGLVDVVAASLWSGEPLCFCRPMTLQNGHPDC